MRRGVLGRRLRPALLAVTVLVAAAVALLVTAGVAGERAELATVDARFAVRGETPPPRDLVVVAIDDVTFDELPPGQARFPFDRRIFAKVLEVVAAGRPRAIVYDVQFTEPQGDRDEDVAADNALIEAAREAGRVVFSSTEVDAKGRTNVFGGAEGQEYAGAIVGNGLFPPGPDGVIRRVPPAIGGLPTIAVRTLERLGRPVRPAAFEDGGAWIDFHGGPGGIRTVSFSRAYLERLPAETFRDRIVVIGATAPVLQDRHETSAGGPMAGPEIHANAISTLLRGMPLRSAAGWVDLLLALVLSALVPLLGLRARAPVVLAAAVAAAAGYAIAVQVAFQSGRVLAFVGPTTGLVIGTAGTLLALLLTATVEKERMRDLFARFVPDAVVDEVLARSGGGDPRLGGVRLVSTVMFSDLRGFTTFAERREPEEVIAVLNRYLTLMSDAILDHGGTLVAYMGDGIMAVFGAPIGSDDHAERAVAAARAMLGRLEEFNAWMAEQGHGDGFRMGIGLNSGEVMSGNVGSDRRLEYTAIGDTTNTAARLEAMTKDTPYQLFVAGPTYERLTAPPEDLEFAGELEVRGREGRLPVWGLKVQ